MRRRRCGQVKLFASTHHFVVDMVCVGAYIGITNKQTNKEIKMTITQYNSQRADIVAHYEAMLAQEQDSVEVKMLKIDLDADLRRLDNAKLAAEIY
jgi:hypothetical protein